MNMRPLLFSCLIALTLTACERVEEPTEEKTAEVAAIAVPTVESNQYEQDGLSFEYPKGWNVVEDVVQDAVRYVFIESPDESALSSIQIFPIDDTPTLEQFVNSYSEQTRITPLATDNTQAEDSPAVIEPIEFMTISRDLNGKTYDWVVETVPNSVAGIQTSDYREYFRKDSARFAAFLVNQVSNDYLTQTEPSFELIFRTLKPAD